MMNPRLPTRFLRLGGAFLLLMALFFLSQSSQTTAAGLGSGPGGVDSTDGAGNLRLWLRASDLNLADTNPVATWTDQSGYGNNATQGTAANRPAFRTNILNGQPVIRFDGVASPNNDYLNLPFILNPINPYTLVAVAQVNNTTNTYSIVQQRDTPGMGRTLLGINNTANVYSFLGGATRNSDTTVVANTPYLLITTWTGNLNGTHRHFRNGIDNTPATNPTFNAETADGVWLLGVGKNLTSNIWPGDMAEIIVFDRVINEAERTLVFNYLNAKYGIALAGNDFYAGDTGGNGDFDFDVAGIGRQGGANSALALAGGLQVANNTFLQDDGDFLIFGHDGTANANSAADLPSGVVQRWTRAWYVDVTDDPTTVGGTVDITFDFSEAGMSGSPAGAAANYRLLTRAGLAGAFADVASATSIAGDQVTFTGIDIADVTSVYMTLGTADAAVSPTAVTLQTTDIATTTAWPLLVLALLLGAATAVLSLRQRTN